MTGPWDHHPDDHGDQHHDVPDLPEEPASLSADDAWSTDHGDLADPGPDHLASPPAGDEDPHDGHGELPAEQPADWSETPEPEPAHADWSSIVDSVDHDGGEDPDPTDPAGWGVPADDPFPPSLSLDVEPADGGPWADPGLLGGDPAEQARTDPPLALLSDLTAADGGDSTDWAAVETSDDPAVRSLAAYWRTAV